MRFQGENSVGMLQEQMSPSEGPAWSKPWCSSCWKTWWRFLCLPSSSQWLRDKPGELYSKEVTPSLQQSQSLPARLGVSEKPSRITGAETPGRLQRLVPALKWGPVNVKDSQVTQCYPLCRDIFSINQTPLGANIRWGNVPAMEFAHA